MVWNEALPWMETFWAHMYGRLGDQGRVAKSKSATFRQEIPVSEYACSVSLSPRLLCFYVPIWGTLCSFSASLKTLAAHN